MQLQSLQYVSHGKWARQRDADTHSADNVVYAH